MLSIFYVLSILIAKLSHVTSQNTFVSNNTHWKSLSNFIPSENSSYGTIILHHAVEMEFDFIYYGSTSAVWENVFRIGYGGDHTKCSQAGTRYPSMWKVPGKDEFQISISDPSAGKCWDANTFYIEIQKYHLYHIFITFNHTWRFASIYNGTTTNVFINEARDSSSPDNDLHQLMNVWISSVSTVAANVTLSNITFKTWDPITTAPTSTPTITPTISPTNIPTIFTSNPSETPSLIPTIIPSITPSYTPTNNPTETVVPTSSSPSISPSTNPSDTPTTTQTYSPTEDEINAREPTNSPLDEGHIPESTIITTFDMINKSTFDNLKSTSHSSWMNINADSIILIIPILIGFFIFMLCCFMFLCCKRYNLQIQKSLSPKSPKNNSKMFSNLENNDNDNDNEDMIQLNMEIQKQKQQKPKDNTSTNNNDILLPNDDSFESLSSNEVEEMYKPQRQTITGPQHPPPIIMEKSDQFNISLQEHRNSNTHIKSYSFNKNWKNRSYSQQISQSNSKNRSYSHELELQHHINNNNNGEGLPKINNDTIVHVDEHGSDSEEEEDDDIDLDVYNGVAPPSSGGPKYMIKQINNQKQLIMSHSTTPEMDLYGKGNISNGVDFMDNDDIKSNDSLYVKPNKIYLETPTKNRRNENAIAELYDKPLYMEKENTEGSDDYEWIQQSLQICDPVDWEKYLNNFQKNKVSDFRLNQLTENDWTVLIPTIGPRNYFKQLWVQYEKQNAKSLHL